jgi:tRNA(fMet)-specific endonuclease VapC
VSRYLLETDALIDFSKGREPATSRILQLIEQGDELGVCAVNVAEFFAGLPPSDRPYWQRVFSTLAYWEVSIAAAWHAGEWRYDFARRGRALPVTDTLIAAVAVEQGATILTANVADYPMAGVSLLSLRG